MEKINVLDKEISIISVNTEEYICLTDIARYKDAARTDYIIQNWLRNRNTIEFLGIWEHLNNPDFKPIEFDGFRKKSGLNSFILTAKQCYQNIRLWKNLVRICYMLCQHFRKGLFSFIFFFHTVLV